jgi:hypothetical protein
MRYGLQRRYIHQDKHISLYNVQTKPFETLINSNKQMNDIVKKL